jgi:hypothetical protein
MVTQCTPQPGYRRVTLSVLVMPLRRKAGSPGTGTVAAR